MTVIGISGSPIVGGNTDRIIEAILERSGRDQIFVNLSTLRYDSCRACAHLCSRTNLCPLDDDLKPYFEPIMNAEALVLGTPIHAGFMSGWMSSFTTRLSCFSHVTHPLEDKPAVLVVTAGFEGTESRAVEQFERNVIQHSGGANVVGHIFYASTIVPCFKCGRGNVCRVGALWHLVGRDEEKLRNFRFRKEIFNRWEDCPETVAKVDQYAKLLAEL